MSQSHIHSWSRMILQVGSHGYYKTIFHALIQCVEVCVKLAHGNVEGVLEVSGFEILDQDSGSFAVGKERYVYAFAVKKVGVFVDTELHLWRLLGLGSNAAIVDMFGRVKQECRLRTGKRPRLRENERKKPHVHRSEERAERM
jgi:hypothetical protein